MTPKQQESAMTRSWMPVLIMSTLAACSPYVYPQEIAGFGTGVDAVVAGYRTGRQAVDGIVAQQQGAADAAVRARLLLLPGCDQMDPVGSPPRLPDCAVVAFDARANLGPTAAQRALADAAPAFDALKAYAEALTAVTLAGDDTKLNHATQALTTAAGGVVRDIGKARPATAPASALVSPVGGLFGMGLTLWLDQRRLAVLRRTVPEADPSVQQLGQTVEAALADIRAQQVLQLGSLLRSDAEVFEVAEVSQLDVADYRDRRVMLESAVAAFKQARSADPAATVAKMLSAHRQLAQALQADTGQAAAMLSDVHSFIEAAEALKNAIEAAPTTPVKRPSPAHR
jgi:hypothetical protein